MRTTLHAYTHARTQLLDSSAAKLVAKWPVAQYILTFGLLSELLALLATGPERADILDALFSCSAVQLFLRPASMLLEVRWRAGAHATWRAVCCCVWAPPRCPPDALLAPC